MGRIEGMIDVIETLLIARGIPVSQMTDYRIRDRFDTDDLDAWVYRALTARTITRFLETTPGNSHQRYRPEMTKTSAWLRRGRVKVPENRHWKHLVRRHVLSRPGGLTSPDLRGRGYLVLPARELESELLGREHAKGGLSVSPMSVTRHILVSWGDGGADPRVFARQCGGQVPVEKRAASGLVTGRLPTGKAQTSRRPGPRPPIMRRRS
jgi:hypothetical protein